MIVPTGIVIVLICPHQSVCTHGARGGASTHAYYMTATQKKRNTLRDVNFPRTNLQFAKKR